MSSETDKKFLISKRDTNYKGIKCEANTTITLYTDIRRFYFKTDFYEKATGTKLADIQHNFNPSFTEDIYNALEKMLVINEDHRAFMIFRDWAFQLDLSESLKQELIRVCSV